MCRTIVGLALFGMALASVCVCHAGSVKTLGGEEVRGEIRLADGAIQVAGGKPIKLEDVLCAIFNDEPPVNAPRFPQSTPDNRIPAPLDLADVGELPKPSEGKYVNGDFSIKSAGARIGAAKDAFCFVRQRIEHDAQIDAHLARIKEPRKVQVGVMVRASNEPDAPFAALMWNGTQVQFIRRSAAGRITEVRHTVLHEQDVWVRLIRRSATITAQWSKNGQTWSTVGGSEAINLESGAFFGLAVAGNDPNQVLGGHIDNVRIAQLPSFETYLGPVAMKQGLMFRTGTLLAGAHILQADESTVRFNKAERNDFAISAASVARIMFVDLSPELAAKIPVGRRGVLLREGDFIEGDFKGVKSGRLQISSVLFGIKSFDRQNQALAIVLGDVEASRPALVVRTSAGSVFVAQSATIEKDRLVVEDAMAGKFPLYRDQITSITAGPGRLQFLDSMKPVAVEGPAGRGALVTRGSVAGMPISLGEQQLEHGMALLAGTRVSWKLDGQYKMLNFRMGVPANVLPTAAVRFSILGDGKEISISHGRPLTSLDDPITGSVDLKGVGTLTIKVECTAPWMTLPAIWGEMSLVK